MQVTQSRICLFKLLNPPTATEPTGTSIDASDVSDSETADEPVSVPTDFPMKVLLTLHFPYLHFLNRWK